MEEGHARACLSSSCSLHARAPDMHERVSQTRAPDSSPLVKASPERWGDGVACPSEGRSLREEGSLRCSTSPLAKGIRGVARGVETGKGPQALKYLTPLRGNSGIHGGSGGGKGAPGGVDGQGSWAPGVQERGSCRRSAREGLVWGQHTLWDLPDAFLTLRSAWDLLRDRPWRTKNEHSTGVKRPTHHPQHFPENTAGHVPQSLHARFINHFRRRARS